MTGLGGNKESSLGVNFHCLKSHIASVPRKNGFVNQIARKRKALIGDTWKGWGPAQLWVQSLQQPQIVVFNRNLLVDVGDIDFFLC